ncbi:unnamed protein product [Lathyrus oleraceus]
MAKILKFIYIIILFLSIFLFSTEAIKVLACETDKDCPNIRVLPLMLQIVYKCINKACRVFLEIRQKS